MLSGAVVVNASLNRCPLGTSPELMTRAATEPVPRPAILPGAPTEAAVQPGTLGSGRTATTLGGRINPPRSVRETGIEVSDGKKAIESGVPSGEPKSYA